MKSVEKKHRRFLAAMLALCLLLGLCPLTPSAQAEETTATAAGSTTIEGAQNVPIGVPVTSTLNTGVNYYAIPDVKAGQQISVELAKKYDGVRAELCQTDGTRIGTTFVTADTSGSYYLLISVQNVKVPVLVDFTVTLYNNDTHEPNDTIGTATPIQLGESVDTTLFMNDNDYFAITTTKPSQYIVLDAQSSLELVYADLYNDMGEMLQSKHLYNFGDEGDKRIFCADEAGTYYLKFSTNLTRISFSFTITLLDNDTNEPNDTKATATELHDGESTEFTVAGSDIDYFKVVTTKPGQDIALTVSGYNYANKDERFNLYFDPAEKLDTRACAAYADISANDTLYFHAAEAGVHYIGLAYYGRRGVTTPVSCTRELSVQILDGDQNEPNDTKESATQLTVGTDAEFMVGGFGDEDWFWFEAAPDAEEKKLYTLSFTGLNTDYSDMFYYVIYAPDGTAVTGTQVNIRHVSTFSCDQQGQYKVRIYTTANNSKNYYDQDWNRAPMDYTRSTLRICVSEGGDDPYESNDTWQTAASVPVGNIQHVLSSTTDADWFCFTVPEDDMTLHLTCTKTTRAALYRAGDLMEQGDRAGVLFNRDTDLYYKLTDAGVYYLRLTADSRYISPEIRTTGIELLPATDEENNDTWKKATPLYEGVPQSFTTIADNDVDWFKIVIPENGMRVSITADYADYYLYSEEDFNAAGDNAAYIGCWRNGSQIVDLNAGTYFLKTSRYSDSIERTVTYRFLPPMEENVSIETAKQLTPGKWVKYYYDGGDDNRCFCIGERKAGEVVRVSRDAAGWGGSLYLLDAAGESIGQNYEGGHRANYTFRIPADGSYYLKTKVYRALDDNGRPLPNRLRYDVGSGEEKVSAIESADSFTLLEGETMFLDLRCALYGAMSGVGKTFYCDPRTHADWDEESGYLRAKSAGTGTLTVGMYNRVYIDSSDAKKEIPVTVLARDDLKALGVSIANVPGTMALGKSADLTAAYTLKSGVVLTNPEKAVTWTSSDPKVLYVAPGGRVVAVGGGTATVTAAVGGVSEESAPITVTAAETPQETVSSIKLNKYSLTLYVGEAGEQLTASILPEGSTARVIWASSNTKAAAVSPDGVVTPIAPGMSTITAEAGGRHVSATVTVFAERVRVTGVSFDETEHKIPVRGTAKLTATIAPADATVKTLVWTSDDPGIASVSRTGIVTAVSVGTTKIHATSVDGNHSAEITVTVTPNAELGDVNGDGYIDSADAMLCLRYSVGLKELTKEQKRAANVNHDSFVDAGDAIKILRYDAKLIESLN
mgnify:CR=1 FL=1